MFSSLRATDVIAAADRIRPLIKRTPLVRSDTLSDAAGGDVFQAEWLEACKGNRNNVTHGTSSKTHCDFDYSGTMIEQMLLGLVAHRVGKKITYDPATGKVTNAPEANDYLKRTYRSGWTLNG